MSVCFFGAEELANVARVIASNAGHGPHDQLWCDRLTDACAKLARISGANARCYAYRYAHTDDAKPEGVPAAEIEQVARAMTGENFLTACSTAGLFHYNCQEDKDFLAKTRGGLAALSDVLSGVLFAAERHTTGSARARY